MKVVGFVFLNKKIIQITQNLLGRMVHPRKKRLDALVASRFSDDWLIKRVYNKYDMAEYRTSTNEV